MSPDGGEDFLFSRALFQIQCCVEPTERDIRADVSSIGHAILSLQTDSAIDAAGLGEDAIQKRSQDEDAKPMDERHMDGADLVQNDPMTKTLQEQSRDAQCGQE